MHVIAVGSGKGGVGKSTVALNVALALAELGDSVGILDADVYGPNIPLMLNLTRKVPNTHWDLAGGVSGKARRIAPVERHGIKVMSAGFIVAEDQAIAWDAGLIRALLWQLVHQVEWGDLDYLLVDLPPGTADVQQMFAKTLPLSGAVIVVTPQDVAHLDAKKAIQMFRSNGVEVVGAIENMSGLICPHCDERIEVFHPVSRERSIWELGIKMLGSIPLDPEQSRASDSGHPVMVVQKDSVQAKAFRWVAQELAERLAELKAPKI